MGTNGQVHRISPMNESKSNIAALQQQLAYQFKDGRLLKAALTHRSCGRHNNERLEFLGDAVLGTVIARALYENFNTAKEGELTRMRARLVRGETLATIAHELALEQHLLISTGELKSGGRQRSSIRADALEAILGGIYLDSDFATVSRVILALFATRLRTLQPDIDKDAKTRLQEAMQQLNLPLPRYEIISQFGKLHDLSFTVQCTLNEPEQSFIAIGKSRRAAEQQAATNALKTL